ARMVGLPYVGTVGACAGKMVAMTSPNELRKKFNWSRVLRHEFVHVLNLQQTDFNVPHWFTEALAVETEGYARPQTWNELLRTRVPKGELFNLETINLGFVRPASSLDWQMAYCQAQLYARYMLRTYGDDALARMLAAYADNLQTKAALRRAFGVEQAAFEQGYRKYLDEIAAELAPRQQASELARQAGVKMAEKQLGEAARLYRQAVELEPHNLQWSKLLAKLYLKTGDDDKLAEVLQRLVDADPDDVVVRKKLAQLALAGRRFADAARWCAAANQIDVMDPRVHRMWGDALAGEQKFSEAIEEYEVAVRLDADDPQARFGLAKACQAAGKAQKAAAALKALLDRWPDRAEAKTLLEKLDE
ncbi:MAG TPA: tetratricopeptide repeat protein, partial [Pirellulales bacterium]|nr:tetratricopeptide repeat protein [Pirellulales bacterium]